VERVMDALDIKKSTDELIAQFPGAEAFIEGVRISLTASVKEVVGEALSGLADGIGQIVGLGQAIDGATVIITSSGPISITIPTFKATISMPLKPKE
jgi:hypothetical protein